MRAISLFNWPRSRSSRANDVDVQRAGRPGLAGSLGLGMGRGSTHTVLGMEVRVLWQTRSAARHEAIAWAFHGKVRESHFWLSFFSPHNCYLAVPCPSCLSLHLAICFGTFPCSFDIARLSQPTSSPSCFPASFSFPVAPAFESGHGIDSLSPSTLMSHYSVYVSNVVRHHLVKS